MKPSAVKKALKTAIRANRPVHVWGAPGIGKSDVMRQTAAELNLELRDVRAVLLDPVDLRGLPHLNGDGRAHWAVPEFLPRTGSGILFLDELNAAPQLVQAACYQLILDRRLGEYELPEGWVVIAAGNNQSDRAVVHAMPTALRNRFVHIDFEIDHDDWVAWALENDIRPETIAFIRFRPEVLHKFDPSQKDAKAFPTPRSWSFVSDIMKSEPDAEIEADLYAGCVGQGAAVEFTGFLRIFRDLPSFDAILLDPKKTPVPQSPAALYAVATGLATRVTTTNFDIVLTYAARLPKEFEVLLVRDAQARVQGLAVTKAFIGWAVKNQDITR